MREKFERFVFKKNKEKVSKESFTKEVESLVSMYDEHISNGISKEEAYLKVIAATNTSVPITPNVNRSLSFGCLVLSIVGALLCYVNTISIILIGFAIALYAYIAHNSYANSLYYKNSDIKKYTCNVNTCFKHIRKNLILWGLSFSVLFTRLLSLTPIYLIIQSYMSVELFSAVAFGIPMLSSYFVFRFLNKKHYLLTGNRIPSNLGKFIDFITKQKPYVIIFFIYVVLLFLGTVEVYNDVLVSQTFIRTVFTNYPVLAIAFVSIFCICLLLIKLKLRISILLFTFLYTILLLGLDIIYHNEIFDFFYLCYISISGVIVGLFYLVYSIYKIKLEKKKEVNIQKVIIFAYNFLLVLLLCISPINSVVYDSSAIGLVHTTTLLSILGIYFNHSLIFVCMVSLIALSFISLILIKTNIRFEMLILSTVYCIIMHTLLHEGYVISTTARIIYFFGFASSAILLYDTFKVDKHLKIKKQLL